MTPREQQQIEIAKTYSKVLILSDAIEHYLTENNGLLQHRLKWKMNKYLKATTQARKDLEFHYTKPEHAEIMGNDSDNFIELVDNLLDNL